MAGYSVVISAVDRMTGTLDKINRKIESSNKQWAGMTAPVARAQASIAKFSQVSGLNRVGRSFRDIAYGARDAFAKISQIVAPLGVITGAASLAGMYRLVSEWSDWGSKLGFAAQNMNITAGALSNLQGAARIAGSSAGSLTSGMQTLGQTMFDAIGGRAPEAIVMFNTLGISFRDATGHARSVAEVMPEIADKIASIKDPFVQARIATEMFGGAGADLLPFLRKGAAGIREYAEASQRYLDVTPESTAAANQFREAQTRLTMSVEGLGNSISTQLSPILAPLLTQMADWISANRDWIATSLADNVRDLANWLKSIDWHEVGTEIRDWGNSARRVVDAFGGIKTAVELVLGIMVATFAVKMILPWVQLASVIVGATTKMRLFGAAQLGLGGLGRLAVAGAAGDALVNAVDPTDRTGAWIDRNIPGAAWLDNQASRIGLGRSYADQQAANGSGATGGERPTTTEQQSRAQDAAAYFVSRGWTPAQAAGIAANLLQESGFNGGAVGDNGSARGIAQWHSDRQSAIEQHFGKSVGDMSVREQLDAVNWELRSGGEQQAGRRLALSTSAADAGAAVSQFYERPANTDAEAAGRGKLADQIASRFAAGVAQGPSLQAPTTSGAAVPNGGTIDLRLHHANDKPDGFEASLMGGSGSLGGAQIGLSNVIGAYP